MSPDSIDRALTHAAATLHNASNALCIARRYCPVAVQDATIDAVTDDINNALDAIALVIGVDAMICADWPDATPLTGD